MELSSDFNRIHFLLELKYASPDVRIFMLQNITPGQLACIEEIARRIYHQTFPLLAQDLGSVSLTFVYLRTFSCLRICVHIFYEIRKCVSLKLAYAKRQKRRTYEFVNTLYG